MSHIKVSIYALLISVFATFSSNSFAFDMPKEFVTIHPQLNTQSASLNSTISDIKTDCDDCVKSVKAALLTQYSNWKGTHYLWGGIDHHGVDCSSLIQQILKDSLHKKLPRTTSQQITKGQMVSKNNLKPGDLVFFKTSPSTRHVGVYIGEHQFIHASKSQGVTISSLDKQFWIDHYETARHLQLMS